MATRTTGRGPRIIWNYREIGRFEEEDEGVRQFVTVCCNKVKTTAEGLLSAHAFFKTKISVDVPRTPKTKIVGIVRFGGGHPGKLTAIYYEAKHQILSRALRVGL